MYLLFISFSTVDHFLFYCKYILTRYTINGARILATYPMICIRATPCALTTVGSSSAAYWSPMLYEMLIANLPIIAIEADGIPIHKEKVLNAY